jgi:protein-tyrosine phosphatase
VQPIVPVPAEPNDAPALLDLRNQAARWQLAQGIVQWREDEVAIPVYAKQIDEGEWFVLRDGSIIVGALRLLWEDVEVWGHQPPVAGYLHHLVTHRALADSGTGARLLAWACAQVRKVERSLLRLDCQERNGRLRAYYRGQDFVEVGRTDFPPDSGWWPVTRLERQTR